MSKCFCVNLNVIQFSNSQFKDDRTRHIEFRISCPILFLFFVTISVTIEKILSASAFALGKVNKCLESFDNTGKTGLFSKFFNLAILNQNSSTGRSFNFCFSLSVKLYSMVRNSCNTSFSSMLSLSQIILKLI